MTVNCSTFFRTNILGESSFNDLMGGGVVRIFTGAQPANADQPEQGTLLGVASVNAAPWVAGAPYGGINYIVSGIAVIPEPGASIAFNAVASGVAGWFRIVANAADSGSVSLTNARIDGSIGNGGGAPTDMVWSDTTVAEGSSYPINTLTFIFPPL